MPFELSLETSMPTFLSGLFSCVVLHNRYSSETFKIIESFDIVKAPVAKKAIPNCNIQFMEGAEMKAAVSGYLQTLFDQNPKAVGGAMPTDEFYYER